MSEPTVAPRPSTERPPPPGWCIRKGHCPLCAAPVALFFDVKRYTLQHGELGHIHEATWPYDPMDRHRSGGDERLEENYRAAKAIKTLHRYILRDWEPPEH